MKRSSNFSATQSRGRPERRNQAPLGSTAPRVRQGPSSLLAETPACSLRSPLSLSNLILVGKWGKKVSKGQINTAPCHTCSSLHQTTFSAQQIWVLTWDVERPWAGRSCHPQLDASGRVNHLTWFFSPQITTLLPSL